MVEFFQNHYKKERLMANRTRHINEKVKAVEAAIGHINMEAAARDTGVPASTLRFD